MIFEGISVTRNCLRPKSGILMGKGWLGYFDMGNCCKVFIYVSDK